MVDRLFFRSATVNISLAWITLLVFSTSISISALSQDKVLHSFGSSPDDGASPFDAVTLVQGKLYGTTQSGGGGAHPGGTVFELSPSSNGTWTEKVLLRFQAPNGDAPDGYGPVAGLAADAAGNLYGTTEAGGVKAYGVIFKLAPDDKGGWRETVLHDFDGNDGWMPMASMIFDKAGILYGTTSRGGSRDGGAGNVFKLSPNSDGTWTETVLFTFNSADGSQPMGGLTFDAAGNLYGTTDVGGANRYFGNVYKLSPGADGKWTETVLYSFDGANGGYGIGNVVLDKAGNLYGTTFGGGDNACQFGCGVVFELSPSPNGTWTYTVLHRFTGGSDGADPYAGLTIDDAGNLYGTTGFGGDFVCEAGCGVVFKLSRNQQGRWDYAVLDSFDDNDGAAPESNLILGPSGTLFGTSLGGGSARSGVVFELAQ